MLISWKNDIAIGFTVFMVLALCISFTAHAGPPFYWWHVDLNISHSNCVKRAQPAIATEIVVNKINKGSTGATAWNSNTSIVVHCVKTGNNKSEAIIFVSGIPGKGNETKETMAQIRSAMKSGIFE